MHFHRHEINIVYILLNTFFFLLSGGHGGHGLAAPAPAPARPAFVPSPAVLAQIAAQQAAPHPAAPRPAAPLQAAPRPVAPVHQFVGRGLQQAQMPGTSQQLIQVTFALMASLYIYIHVYIYNISNNISYISDKISGFSTNKASQTCCTGRYI